MGEIAEMLLDGLLDEETGELIDGTAPGYPRRMSDMMYATEAKKRLGKTVACPGCARKFACGISLNQHRDMKGH